MSGLLDVIDLLRAQVEELESERDLLEQQCIQLQHDLDREGEDG